MSSGQEVVSRLNLPRVRDCPLASKHAEDLRYTSTSFNSYNRREGIVAMPYKSCAHATCRLGDNKTSRDMGITFHKFPKNLERREKWSRLMGRCDTWLARHWSVVCSKHFKPEEFDRTGQTVRLRENVEPSIFDVPKVQKKTFKRISGNSCDVVSCTSSYTNRPDGVSFFRYPKEPEIRRKWNLAIRGNVNKDPPCEAVVCSLHFKPEEFYRNEKTVELKENVVPSVFRKVSRPHRKRKRKFSQSMPTDAGKRRRCASKSLTVVTKLKCDAAEALLSLGDADSQEVVIKNESDVEQTVVKQECFDQPVVLLTRIPDPQISNSRLTNTQTAVQPESGLDQPVVLLTRIPDRLIANSQLTNTTSSIDSAAENMEKDVENPAQRSQESQTMETYDTFQPLQRHIPTTGILHSPQKHKVDYGDDFSFLSVSKVEKKFHFYTGLTVSQFSHLMSYLGPNSDNLVSGAISCRAIQKQKKLLSYKNQLFLTLIKLRQAYSNKVLASRFKIGVQTVAFIVKTWIYFMHSRTTELRKRMLPSRELTQKNLPKCFNYCKNVRVIVDYFEILAQQPRNFFEHDCIYPSYKCHSTYKVLIGISPTGGVAYLSDAFEDKLSDMELFLKSGLVDRLEPEDLVIADTGFAIQQVSATKNMNSGVPPAQENKNRLSPQEQLLTKSIARMKKYKIIDRTVCLALKPFISKIVHIVGLLVNYQEPLVVK